MTTRAIHCVFVIALLCATAVAPRAAASNAWLDMQIDISGPGTWALYAETSYGDNAGILGYSIPVLDVLTISHVSPYSAVAHDGTFSLFGGAGFSFERSPDGDSLIQGFQEFVFPAPFQVYGFGQVDSDFGAEGIVPLGGNLEQPDWGVPLLLAEGTYGPGQSPAVDDDSDDLAMYVFDDNFGTSWHEPEITTLPYIHNPLLDAEITVVAGEYVTYQFPPAYEPPEYEEYDVGFGMPSFTGPGANHPPYTEFDGLFYWDTAGSTRGTYKAQITYGNVFFNQWYYSGTFIIHLVPEPASALLVGLGAVGLVGAFRRRRT